MGLVSTGIKFLGGLLAGAPEPPSVMPASNRAILTSRDSVAARVVDAPIVRAVAGFITLDDGSRVLMSASGVISRPQFFLVAGAQIPGGARIVSVSPDGLLFGLRRPVRRRTFRTELNRCKNVVRSADKLLTLLRKGKR